MQNLNALHRWVRVRFAVNQGKKRTQKTVPFTRNVKDCGTLKFVTTQTLRRPQCRRDLPTPVVYHPRNNPKC